MPYFVREVLCPINSRKMEVYIYYLATPDGKFLTKPNGCENWSGCAKCQECLKPFYEVLDKLPD